MKHLFEQLEQSRWQLIQALAKAEKFNKLHLRDSLGRFAGKAGKSNPAKKTGAGAGIFAAIAGAVIATEKVKIDKRIAASEKAGAVAVDHIKDIPNIKTHLKELGISLDDVLTRTKELYDLKGIPGKFHQGRTVDALRFVENIEEIVSERSASKISFQKTRQIATETAKTAGAKRDASPGLRSVLEHDKTISESHGLLWRRSAVSAEINYGKQADELLRAEGEGGRAAAHKALLTRLKKNNVQSTSVHVVGPDVFLGEIEKRFGKEATANLIKARYFSTDPRSERMKGMEGKLMVNALSPTLFSRYDPNAAQASLEEDNKNVLKLNQMAVKPLKGEKKIIVTRTDYAGGFNVTQEGKDTLIEAGLDPKVLVHEYAHSLESNNLEMQAKIQAFRYHRSARSNGGKPLVGKVPDGLGPVLSYLDDFPKPYSGKIYAESALTQKMTEISSTALEGIFSPRVVQQQLGQDREQLMTVLGALGGD